MSESAFVVDGGVVKPVKKGIVKHTNADSKKVPEDESK
jgi:hypothetical protein